MELQVFVKAERQMHMCREYVSVHSQAKIHSTVQTQTGSSGAVRSGGTRDIPRSDCGGPVAITMLIRRCALQPTHPTKKRGHRSMC